MMVWQMAIHLAFPDVRRRASKERGSSAKGSVNLQLTIMCIVGIECDIIVVDHDHHLPFVVVPATTLINQPALDCDLLQKIPGTE